MTFLGFLIMAASACLVFSLPRQKALVPLLLGVVYAPFAQTLEIGSLNFSVIRLLTVAGILRVMFKGEKIAGGLNGLDRCMILWGAWAICTSVFHKSGALTFRLGLALDCVGIYFVFRVLVQNLENIRNSFKIVCIPFVPVAVGMMIEKLTGKNAFAFIGGVPLTAGLRHGHYRGQGPFGHAILAGTIGALTMPMALCFWRDDRRRALIGMAAGFGIVVASGSSGPAMTLLTILAAMAFWRVRGYLRVACWAGVMLIIALDIVMKDPVYFLLARIDLTGGSTGWHRAALIQAAIQHLGTWWLGGTDYTRDWMPTGVYWSPDHTDITNHFIQMGVWGGLPLMLLFMGCVWAGFTGVGRALREHSEAPVEDRFIIWTLGAILFGHVTSFLSVSYYDQTVVFFYLLLASIGSLWATQAKTAEMEAPGLAAAAAP